MTGKYELELYNNRLHYHLVIKRSITIIQGNSATGKSAFIRLLSAYNANPRSSGITLICDRPCTVLTAEDWQSRISGYSQRILFLDEDALFMKSQEFAEAVLHSDNYFVIITRDELPQLPYSIEEIYALHDVSDSRRYRNARQVYNEMRQLYHSEEFIHLKPESAIFKKPHSKILSDQRKYRKGSQHSSGGNPESWERKASGHQESSGRRKTIISESLARLKPHWPALYCRRLNITPLSVIR